MVKNDLFPKELSHKGQVAKDRFSCSEKIKKIMVSQNLH